jgi:hypothetical protein
VATANTIARAIQRWNFKRLWFVLVLLENAYFEIEFFVNLTLLHVWQNQNDPAELLARLVLEFTVAKSRVGVLLDDATGGQQVVDVFIE